MMPIEKKNMRMKLKKNKINKKKIYQPDFLSNQNLKLNYVRVAPI